MSPPHPHVHCLLCIVTQAQQAMQKMTNLVTLVKCKIHLFV